MAANLGLKIVEWVNRLARRVAAKPDASGIMTIPNRQMVIDTTNEILTKFKKHGVPNDMIRSENDVKVIYNQILNLEEQQLRRNVISPGDPRHKEITEKLLGKKKTTADLIDLGLVRKGENVKKTTPKEPVDSKLVEEVKVKETFDDFNARQNQTDVVADTVTRIISMEPVAALKEANKVIGRKGVYKNLTKEQSQKILKDSEDWIFQRDPDDLYDYNKKRPFRDDADPEDLAEGGRTGTGLNYLLGEDDQNMRVPYKTGLKVYPRVSAVQTGETPNGLDVGVREVDYGGTGIYQGNNWFGGMEGSKGNVKVDVEKDGDTLFKDTMSKDDVVNFIAGLGNIEGDKFQIKTDKDLNNVSIVFKKTFADGGLAPMLGEPTYANGGRIGLKKGHSPGRRKFLKVAAGLASIPIVGKFFKWAKPAAKVADVTSVPIKAGVDGMPVWFKPLVNRVIKEGEEISSHGDRIITHKATLPNSKTDIYITQDLNTGDVVADIGMGKHGWSSGHLGQPVRLEYKAGEVIEPSISKTGKIESKGTKTKDEFWVEEAEFTGGHPENVKFEESTLEKFGQHGSNFDEVEMFATGKVKKSKPTKKAERTEYESGKAEADAEAAADMADDFASGGRVPRSGGLAGMLGE